jgi:hypothetical protein
MRIRNQRTKILIALLLGLAIGCSGTLIGIYAYSNYTTKHYYEETELSTVVVEIGGKMIYKGYFFEENNVELGWIAQDEVTFKILNYNTLILEMLGEIEEDTDVFYLPGDNPLIYLEHVGDGGAFAFDVPKDGEYYFIVQNNQFPLEEKAVSIIHNQNFDFEYYDI